MKKIPVILASTLSIAFIIPVVERTIAKPNKSKLPEVGIVKSPDRDIGCFYWQSDRTTKKLEISYDLARKKLNVLMKKAGKTGIQSTEWNKTSEELRRDWNLLEQKTIFSAFGANKPKMNLNGSDTSLNLMSEKRITETKRQQTYKANNTVIKLTTIDTWHGDATADVKGTMSIENFNTSKTLKVRGICVAD
jgi:hypothetical protein